jgi:CelD/BcsL family acetyltransferase involved in cellulose biosynthesis
MTATASSDHAPIVALERTASAIASARRAMLADRYAINSFAVEWVKLAELEPITDQWRDLAASALEPNIFYEPGFALAAVEVFGRDVGAALVWSGTEPRRLVGFFPARIETRRYGLKLPVLVGWTHPYAPLGTPLVERGVSEPVIAAWLEHLAGTPSLPGLLLRPHTAEDGPFAAALDRILKRTQMPCFDFDRHQRAQLAPAGDGAYYVERALGVRKLKELRRIVRRMGDMGALLFTTATEPTTVDAAVEDFLVLEASGWKGRAGTAAACRDDIRRFIKAALGTLAVEGKVAVHRLLLDGRAIAAAITLRSDAMAWFWKIAYDENLARYSPGVVLATALTEELADDGTVERTDSCATANHPMIDHIWRERLALCDRLIAVRQGAGFGRARRLELLRRGGIAALKRMRKRFRLQAGVSLRSSHARTAFPTGHADSGQAHMQRGRGGAEPE